MAKGRKPHQGRRRASEGVGGDITSLPALSSLLDVPQLQSLVPSSEQRDAFASSRDRAARELGIDPAELAMGCVVRLDRGFPAVALDDGIIRAEHAVQLAKDDSVRPAVGDWVVVRRPDGHDMGVIEEVLPRRSELARWRGRSRGERQTLAANVDVVLVAQQLSSEPVACDRMARSAVIALDGRCEVAVVLTKADRAGAEGIARDVARIRAVMGDVAIAVTSSDETGRMDEALAQATEQAGAAWGMDAVCDLVPRGRVGIFLGESGAGKSTLLNALLGHEALETGAVRDRDDQGRHTTVARRMVELAHGGVIVDAPGLRSLPLVGHERGLMRVFPEVSDAARGCRFRDCTHGKEPGCNVRAQLDAGAITPERLEVYLALASEMRASAATLDPDVVI